MFGEVSVRVPAPFLAMARLPTPASARDASTCQLPEPSKTRGLAVAPPPLLKRMLDASVAVPEPLFVKVLAAVPPGLRNTVLSRSTPSPMVSAPAPLAMVMLPSARRLVVPTPALVAPLPRRRLPVLAPVRLIVVPAEALPKPPVHTRSRSPGTVPSHVATSPLPPGATPPVQFAPSFRLIPSPAPVQVALAA